MEDDPPHDLCKLVTYRDIDGSAPTRILVADNDFHILNREKACLISSKGHWDFASGIVLLSKENHDRQNKGSPSDPLIDGCAFDPCTLLKVFGANRQGKANRIEKEGRALVASWNKAYGPSSKSEFCMPKSVLFKIGSHSWNSRMSTPSGEDFAFLFLELSTYRFSNAHKEARNHGEPFSQKITCADLEVQVKIGSTKLSRTKPDLSNAVAVSKHTTVYEGLGSSKEVLPESLMGASFDRWGFRCKLPEFVRMLLDPKFSEVVEACMKTLRCKGFNKSDIESISGGLPYPTPPAPSPDGPEQDDRKSSGAKKKSQQLQQQQQQQQQQGTKRSAAANSKDNVQASGDVSDAEPEGKATGGKQQTSLLRAPSPKKSKLEADRKKRPQKKKGGNASSGGESGSESEGESAGAAAPESGDERDGGEAAADGSGDDGDDGDDDSSTASDKKFIDDSQADTDDEDSESEAAAGNGDSQEARKGSPAEKRKTRSSSSGGKGGSSSGGKASAAAAAAPETEEERRRRKRKKQQQQQQQQQKKKKHEREENAYDSEDPVVNLSEQSDGEEEAKAQKAKAAKKRKKREEEEAANEEEEEEDGEEEANDEPEVIPAKKAKSQVKPGKSKGTSKDGRRQ